LHDFWERFEHLRLLLVQYRQACCAIVEHASHTNGYYSYNTHKPVPRLLSTLRTLPVVTRTIQTSLFRDCWARFAHLRLLLVQYTQACSTTVDHASHTYGYYSCNTDKPVVQLLSTLRTLTVISCTLHTRLLFNCWARFAHLRLLPVQYTQAGSTTVEHAWHTYGYYSYNTHKPVVQLLSTLRTLTVVTRTIHTSLSYNCWARFAHLRLLLVQYKQPCCTIVEHASHTYGYYSYNTHKPVPRLLSALRTLTVITRTIHTSLFHDCW